MSLGYAYIVGVGAAAVELGDLLAVLAVVDEELAIRGTRHVQAAIGGKAHRLAEARVVLVPGLSTLGGKNSPQ